MLIINISSVAVSSKALEAVSICIGAGEFVSQGGVISARHNNGHNCLIQRSHPLNNAPEITVKLEFGRVSVEPV